MSEFAKQLFSRLIVSLSCLNFCVKCPKIYRLFSVHNSSSPFRPRPANAFVFASLRIFGLSSIRPIRIIITGSKIRSSVIQSVIIDMVSHVRRFQNLSMHVDASVGSANNFHVSSGVTIHPFPIKFRESFIMAVVNLCFKPFVALLNKNNFHGGTLWQN